MKISVLTSDRDLGSVESLPVPRGSWTDVGGVAVYYANPRSWRGRRRLCREILKTPADVVYLNSLFSMWFSIIPIVVLVLSRRKYTILIAPRGELGDGALSIRAVKKKAFLMLARKSAIYDTVFWHASSVREKEEIQRQFPGAQVFVRQNEVKLPARSAENKAEKQKNRLSAVYVGRLAEKKGLLELVKGLQFAKKTISFDIYGQFEDNRYEKRVLEEAGKLPPNVRVQFRGDLPHEAVRETFSSYNVFLFPTYHENFGHTVAESMSASCPVVAADVTPFTSTIEQGGGSIIYDNTPEEWARVVDEWATQSSLQLKNRCHRAGEAYEKWREKATAPSVFEMLPS
ncbi:glycosyltransferase [Dietzia sp. SYD-A1]|uniref:glycosyltransferase n=1 Tax=Dietzia sp. SYD-A1 TaxID=2780141 RepID=UPI0018915E87|nr:glycosyltransferase [Dietzia sp. SYD-A1]